MKCKLLCFLFSLNFSVVSFSQENCEPGDFFGDFIHVGKSEFNSRSFLIKSVSDIKKDACIAPLVNGHSLMWDYLLTNFASLNGIDSILKIGDSLSMNQAYIRRLKKDSLFNAVVEDWTAKTLRKTLAKDTITVDEMLNIAVKYFSIVRLTEEGYYVGKICVGVNDIRKTEATRQPLLEAFCFSVILEDVKTGQDGIYQEFIHAIKELYEVHLGIDPQEKLLRAQGALFFLMRNNERLQKMLVEAYEKDSNSLPFILRK